ncbi:hypothetical protein [Streptomyces sp. URMC 123]|uniref:hypothetical protein n=1 Tax=Streptomyces sp. URMC 123 TaxID=3423403 RepID=UPI003F1A14CF
MTIRKRVLTSLAATAVLLGTATAVAAPATAAPAPQRIASVAAPMDGPPGYVWTGKKYWTLSGCTSGGTDLVATGAYSAYHCDGSGMMWDLWALPK